MGKLSTVAIRAVAVLGLAVSVYLAASRAIGIGEANLWSGLIRPPLRDAWSAPNAWSGLLYSILAERVIGVLRLSEFSLRLPSVLSGAALAWLVWRRKSTLFLVAYVLGVAAGWFATAAGHGIALTLWCYAVDRPRHAAWLFGLAIAASPPFSVLAVAWWRIKDIERVLIPAASLALVLLILPFSHAGPLQVSDARPDFQRELSRRNAARGGGFQPPAEHHK